MRWSSPVAWLSSIERKSRRRCNQAATCGWFHTFPSLVFVWFPSLFPLLPFYPAYCIFIAFKGPRWFFLSSLTQYVHQIYTAGLFFSHLSIALFRCWVAIRRASFNCYRTDALLAFAWKRASIRQATCVGCYQTVFFCVLVDSCGVRSQLLSDDAPVFFLYSYFFQFIQSNNRHRHTTVILLLPLINGITLLDGLFYLSSMSVNTHFRPSLGHSSSLLFDRLSRSS